MSVGLSRHRAASGTGQRPFGAFGAGSVSHPGDGPAAEAEARGVVRLGDNRRVRGLAFDLGTDPLDEGRVRAGLSRLHMERFPSLPLH